MASMGELSLLSAGGAERPGELTLARLAGYGIHTSQLFYIFQIVIIHMIVITGLVPVIHVGPQHRCSWNNEVRADVAGRDKPGHDGQICNYLKL
jgi:hypothetical protein